jgi:hypothetical protein
LIWSRVFNWVVQETTEHAYARDLIEHMIPFAQFDEPHYVLGGLGQIMYIYRLPLYDFIVSATVVCPELIELIKIVYAVYQSLTEHPDLDEPQPPLPQPEE